MSSMKQLRKEFPDARIVVKASFEIDGEILSFEGGYSKLAGHLAIYSLLPVSQEHKLDAMEQCLKVLLEA